MSPANPTPVLVDLQQVAKGYTKGRQHVDVLRAVDLCVAAGEFVALMGPSGSGKSTLLNLMGGLARADRGSVRINNTQLTDMTETARTGWRARNVGFVFQRYHLIPSLTAAQNVEMPLLLHRMPASERSQRVANALDLVGMAHRSSHLPAELSGGQEQRVAIARALVADPPLLLCDEPTGNLDAQAGLGVLEVLAALNRAHGTTIVMVTHSEQAAAFATRMLWMGDGRIEPAPSRALVQAPVA